jgi:hypothetical protein
VIGAFSKCFLVNETEKNESDRQVERKEQKNNFMRVFKLRTSTTIKG